MSVWQAKPSNRYQITPKRVFYISTGEQAQGTIVDFSQLGAYATIDFTGRTEHMATVELDENFAFTIPKYTK